MHVYVSAPHAYPPTHLMLFFDGAHMTAMATKIMK
jgi:hypothetical protein